LEDHVYEEDIDDKSIQSSIHSPLHQSQGLMCSSPFQDLNFHETSFNNDLEEEKIMEEPSIDEENDDE
jgi:hypothetical protein